MVNNEIIVEHVSEDRFRVRIRDHEVVIDQPFEAGGDDQGPSPTELFVASLAGCVAFFVERFLRRHGLPVRGLVVDAGFSMASKPSRVDAVAIRMTLPVPLPIELRDRLLRAAEHCTVHSSILRPPSVRIVIDGARPLLPALSG